MTTHINTTKKCSLCGTPSSHIKIGSVLVRGNPDIDLRPAESHRSTMPTWVQQCPRCGFCAVDLERPPLGAAAVVESQEYRDVLQGPSRWPTLARQFYAVSLLAERAGILVDAAEHAMHAAWACDDENDDEAAIACRMRAITFYVLVANDIHHAAGARANSPAKQPELWNLQLVDLLRRTKRFDEARERCQAAQRSTDPNVQLVGRFQLALIDKLDTAAHSVDEALGKPPPSRTSSAATSNAASSPTSSALVGDGDVVIYVLDRTT